MTKLTKMQLDRINNNFSAIINLKVRAFEKDFKMPPEVTYKDLIAYAKKNPKKTLDALFILESTDGRNSFYHLADRLHALPQSIKLKEGYNKALKNCRNSIEKLKSLLNEERSKILDNLIFNGTEITEALAAFKSFSPKI